MNIEFTETALARLAELPAPLQNALETELRRLAEDPVKLSRKVQPDSPAYPTGSMLFRCFADIGNEQWFFHVLWVWKDSIDEATIVIIAIGPDATFEELKNEF